MFEQNLGAMQKLTAGVAQLDAGGSTLYKGIDTLSAGVSQLYSKTQNEKFCKSNSKASMHLNAGFTQLSAYNDTLLSGASS